MLNISSQMPTQMQLSLLNERGSDLHTGLSSAYSSKPSDGQWMEKNLIFEEEQKASVTTQSENKDGVKGVNQCSICLKKFAYPSKLARHILSHTNIRPFKCHMCLKSFQFRWHLQCHVRTHKKKSQNKIAGHLEQDHIVSFSNAGKSKEQDVHTSSQDQAKDSVTVHQDQNVLKENMVYQKIIGDCSDSDVYLQDTLLNVGDLDLHTGQSSAYSSKPSDGQWMEKNLIFEEEQKASVTTQSEDKDGVKGVNQCSICLKKFAYPSKLARHILSHTNIRPFKCHMCLKSFQFRWQLQCHIRTHKKKGQNKIAGHLEQDHIVSFSNAGKSKEQDVHTSSQDQAKDSVTVHQDQNVLKENMVYQKIIGDCSDSDVYLQDTLLNVGDLDLHTGQSSAYSSKPSDGQWMEKNLIFEEEQKASVTTQSEDKDGVKGVNQCSICLKKFAYPSKLARHILSHTNIRPFKCHMCLKSFQFRWHLQCHVRTHKKKGQNKIAGHLEQDHIVSFSNAGKSKEQDVHTSSQDQAKDSATVHQDQNVLKENMVYQKIIGDCSDSDVYLQDTFLNEGDLDLHTGQSSAYSSKPSDGQWMEKNLIFEEEQKASVTTQSEDKDGVKGVNQCSICLKKFAYPSKLARHILSHTNIRPFKCHMCLKSFQFRWHLQCHVRIHKKKGQNKISGRLEQDGIVSFSNAGKSKEQDVHISSQDRAKDSVKVHQDQNVVKKNMAYQKKSGDCSDSDVYLQDTLLNKGDLDLHTGQSSAYSSKPSDGQWMEKNLIFEEEKEASVTTQSKDKDGVKGVNQCSICLKKFAYPSKLARHILSHTNIRPFKCHMCLKSFQFRWHLQCHVRTHKKKGQNKIAGHLEQDGTVSFSNAGKSIEQDVHTSSQDRAEDTRQSSAHSSNPSDGQWMEKNLIFKEEQEAIVTTQSEDNDVNAKVLQSKSCNRNKRVYECPVCLKRFGAPSKLKRHCLIHTDQRPFQCFICFRGFRERSHLKVHLRTHTNPSSTDAVTPAGKGIFPVSKSSDRICTLQRKLKSGYQCEICLKKFRFPSKLTRHLFVHFDVKAYTCTICKKSFKQAYYLYKHLKVHAGKINYYSSLCRVPQKHGAQSPTPGALKGANNCTPDDGNVCLPQLLDSLETKKHQKPECQSKLNQNVQMIESNSCTVEIKSSDALKNTEEQITTSSPIDLKHKQKGVNQCSICLKNFAFPSKLARHILSHTGIRPFKCHVCLKSFQFRWHLQCHVRIHKKKGRNIIAGHLEQDSTVSLSNAGKSKEQDVQISSRDGAEDPGTVHQDQNMVMKSQKISDSCVYLQVSLLSEGGSDLQTGQSFAYSSKPSEGQWMDKSQQSEKEEEASVTMQSEDTDVNAKVLQSDNGIKNRNKIIYDCLVCHKRFGAPSKLKRHCRIHTNQRPFQCSICCRAFRERSHLKVHIRIHNIPMKRRTTSLQSYRDNSVPCNQASKSKSSSKQLTTQDDEKSTVHQDQNMMITENMASQKISGDCSNSDAYLQASLPNEGDLDLHTGQSFAYSSKPLIGQWMEENQESEEEQVASVAPQSEDKNVNPKVLQSKNSNGNKRVYDCPVCRKQCGALSKLKRHCLIHTNQRPFQCSICCRAFRERCHLKVHIRTHTNPVKQRISSLQSYRDNSVPCNQASKSQLKPSPKQVTAQDDTSSTNKQESTVHQDQKMITGNNMASQKIRGDCSDSDVYLQDSLPNEEGLDLHAGQSSAYSYKLSEGQLIEKKQEFEEEQEASVATQSEDNDVSVKVLQNNNYNGRKRVYECPVCHKRFVAPSKLKRHWLIHTNQKPFQCSICSSAFRERSHLKVHLRTHTNPVKQKTSTLQSYKDSSLPCTRASKSRLKPSPKQPAAQSDTSSTDKQKSTVHQDQHMVTENMASHRTSGHCSDSDVCLQDSLCNEGGLDLHSGQSSVYSSKPSEGQWMDEIQESEEQEASVTIHSEDKDVNPNVLQSKNSKRNKRVYDCPVCHKRFGAPSKLRRHSLIHTNQRPFQCSICCSAFRERSHLKVHIKTHTKPVKRRASSLQSYRDNSFPCTQASKSRLKPSPKQPTAQNDTSSTDKQKASVHQDLNMVTENMAPQKTSGDCSNSDVCLQDSLLNEGRLDLHSGQSSVYSSKPSKGRWIEEIEESEEEQVASVTIHSEDKDVNPKVLPSKNSKRNKRVYDCPVCHKRFGAPSKLKRHSLIHTNQRPFQCSICCSAFRERSHLKVHLRTHTNPVKQRTLSLRSYKDNKVPCKQASKSRFKPSPKQPTAQNDTSSTDKQKSKVHQDLNMVTENMASQKMSGDCSNSNVCLQDSLLNEGGLDLYSGQSSVYSSKPSEGQWMEEIQESEEEQEASVTTQSENMDVNVKVWQSKNSNRSKRVHECHVCHKRFGAPSKLKRHCLIHTNQRPFQCSICCSAFRERSHLKVHLRTHTNPVRQRISSLWSYKDNNVPCKRASKSRFKPSQKQLTAQNNTSSTDKQKSKVHQDLNMVTENMASQKMSGDCSDSDVCLQDSLLNEGGMDLYSGRSSVYSSKPSEGQWMEEIRESEEEQEASLTTQSENMDVNVKVWQSKNSNRSKRVHECPVCHKRFGAPSKLKRHCLIHTNQRPFQCPICCSAFRERSHLKVHIRTMHKDQNMVTEDILSQKMSVNCSDSDLYFSKSTSPLETVKNKSEVVFQCNNKSVWDLTHKTDIFLDGKKTSDIVPFGRVSDCPPKTDSSLRHCASESRTEENWPHPMDDIKDCDFVDSGKCVPDSSLSSSGFQQKPDVPTLPEVVVELEDFDDPGECFPNPPHDLPVCPDCSQCFPSVRDLYAHNCANRYPEGKIKKSHQCDICLKIFSAPSKLKRHWVTHTGQRPFQCTRCQKSFTQPHHLKTHMQSHW